MRSLLKRTSLRGLSHEKHATTHAVPTAAIARLAEPDTLTCDIGVLRSDRRGGVAVGADSPSPRCRALQVAEVLERGGGGLSPHRPLRTPRYGIGMIRLRDASYPYAVYNTVLRSRILTASQRKYETSE
eukprot:4982880-Pleurochrysis_carterae.AAC.2